AAAALAGRGPGCPGGRPVRARRDGRRARRDVRGDEALRDRAGARVRLGVGPRRVPAPPLALMTTTAGISLDDVDLASHDNFVAAVPYEMFAVLRREDPVHWQPEPDGPGFWCITKHADIGIVHRDWQTFSSEVGGTSLQDLSPEQIEARKGMLDMDPPRHNQLRAIINKGFTPR